MSLYAIVRLRGSAQKPTAINYALQCLGLTRVNSCVVLEYNDYNKGQLKKVKDYVTFGEINDDTLKSMVEKRGRLEGDKRITDSFLKEKKLSIDTLLKMYKQDVNKVYALGIKKVFRLSPASKGLKSVKLSFAQGGDLSYRGDKINDLLNKMI